MAKGKRERGKSHSRKIFQHCSNMLINTILFKESIPLTLHAIPCISHPIVYVY